MRLPAGLLSKETAVCNNRDNLGYALTKKVNFSLRTTGLMSPRSGFEGLLKDL